LVIPRRAKREPGIHSHRRTGSGAELEARNPTANAYAAYATMDAPAKRSKLIKGATGDWEVVIGMEVHAQVTSRAKLFSGASTAFGGGPNAHVSLVDAAMPGMLPVINEECVRQAVRTGLGLKARINLKSVFDRKNYFYPDLPQGYQISQYKSPLVGEGEVVVDMPDGETAHVGIERLHLEQDAGKSLHEQHPAMSLVDLNRSGVALMEIVSKPDLRSADEAKAFLGKLRTILRYLGTCDGDMEKGNLRADVNVSVRRPGGPLGIRCEIKNLNSIRFIGQAIEHEARRQIGVIEDGGKIEQETRLFDPAKGETRSMRSKEEAHDYRYFPDPDLLPLELSPSLVADLRKNLPELPDDKKARFMRQYALTPYDAGVLVAERATADYFEAVGKGRDAKAAANWVINELFGRLNKEGKDIAAAPVSAAQLGSILDLIAEGAISGKIAKDVFEIVWNEGGNPRAIVEQRGLQQVTDVSAIEALVDDIIAKNPDKVQDARANPKAIGWFVGQVMKASKGKTNPQRTNKLLTKKLFEEGPRTRQEPLQRGEHLYDYYDESGRDGYDEFRCILNRWLLEIDERHQAEFISRMRYGGNTAFRSTLCELLVHTLLVKLGYKVAVHPSVPGSNKHPDFSLLDEKGAPLCYIEVTTVNRADEQEAHSKREATIYNAINEANLPTGCLLGYNLIQAGPDNPPLHPLVNSIESWARENSDKARAEEVVKAFAAGSWIIELELFAGGNAAAGKPAIGVAAMAGGVIAPHKDIRAALERKSRGYGELNAPYMIVVADAKNELFHKEASRNAITEAVFGDEIAVVIGGKAKRDFAKNGFWIGPHGPRNQYVSAVLLMPDAGIWRLREERWQPILAINPWTPHALPEPLRVLRRLEADDDKWVLREGKAVADILGLPIPWPRIG
jgi:aspartyl-tRNA(Asn)/glutamyl-tRNA(Gln) amidotransferase subunit B